MTIKLRIYEDLMTPLIVNHANTTYTSRGYGCGFYEVLFSILKNVGNFGSKMKATHH